MNPLESKVLNSYPSESPTNWEGLSSEEAFARLNQYGYNEISDKQTNIFLKFLSYFWGPIPWMIEGAIILSAIVHRWEDFYIILVLLVMNSLIGFWEEFHAANAIAALKNRLALKARVKRSGQWISVAARELVPGDLIRIRLGDIIPADASLLDGDPVEVDQSALTGESLPVTHSKDDQVYSGSIVRQGEVDALVTATGKNTFLGKTAQLVQEAQTKSHFQRAILKIGNYLIVIAAILVALILGVAVYRGDPLLQTIEFALVLTVAAIPVAMPTVLSVTLAVGARLLAKKESIVSRLVSIEELAGMNLLCSDKTGTLTQNQLTLGTISALDGISTDEVLRCAGLASRREDADPIDEAILAGLGPSTFKDYQLVHFHPFDPVSKRTEAEFRTTNGEFFKVSKGAVQVILALDSHRSKMEKEVNRIVGEFASKGFRSIGVAKQDIQGDWKFLGVLPLFDPPREDSKQTIATAHQMGIQVKMLTGDQMAIAKQVACEIGLGSDILNASTIRKEQNLEELANEIETADGFAQVFPEHKYKIVKLLQDRGHIVGMTGDGVNDAPALKRADVGIAVSGATDAARAAADIVLLAPGLSVVVDAIKESRKIFQRMNSYATYRITETIRVLLLMTLSILVFNFYPVTAVMIVLLALLNDGAILSIARDRVHYSNDPEVWNMKTVLSISTILGIAGVIASFGLFYLAEGFWHLDRPTIQSLMYLKLSVAGHLTIFVTRTRGPFWSIKPARILLLAVFGTQILASLIAIYGIFIAPIGWKWASVVWIYALAWFLVNDFIKIAVYRVLNRKALPA